MFENSFIGRSRNGWINQNLFYEWMSQVFVPQTAHVKKPLLLLLDGHVSHQSIQTSALCHENGIHLYCLPPHSSHIVQPIDVGVFKTMKAEWKKAVKRQNETEIVTKRTFAITFKDAYETTIARPLAEKAFRACGLYSLDPTNVDFSKVVSDFDDSVTAHPPPQSPLVNGPDSDTPTCLPSPVAHSTPKSSLATACRPESPRPLPTPVAHSTPKSPLATGCQPEPPRPLPTPVAHSTPNPVRSAYPTAGPSHNVDASTQSTNTLRKFSMLCSQIGENTLNLYYTRLEESYDCEDPLFSLCSAYHKELVSLLTAHTWQ